MPTIAEVRQQYPQYSDMSDDALAGALHQKYYSDMPREEFNKKVGLIAQPQEQGVLGKAGAEISDRFNNPKDVSLIGMAGSAYRAFTNPIPEYGDREAATKRGLDIALTASPMSAGAAARRAAVSPVAPKAPVPTVDELKAAATKGYESPEVRGLEIKPEPVKQWATDMRTNLTEAGLDDTIAPKTWAILSKVDKIPEGAFATGKNLDSLRKTLGYAAGSPDAVERKAAVQAISALDEFIPNVAKKDVIAGDAAAAGSTLETARADYSAAKHTELINKKQHRAELRAAAANSGMNVSNTIKQRLADVLVSDKEKRGFSEEQLGLMNQIVEGTPTQNRLRGAANFLGGGGGVGGYVTGITSLGVAPIIGYGLKKLGNYLTTKDVGRLNEMIRSDSPLGKKMAAPLADWSAKAKAFEESPSVQNFARLSNASRNLATNMRDIGVAVQPTDLVRSTRSESEEETSPP